MCSTLFDVSLSPQLRDYIESRVLEGGYANPSDYLRELVRDDQRRRARERLDNLLLEGLQAGPADEVTPAYLEEMIAELETAVENKRRSTT